MKIMAKEKKKTSGKKIVLIIISVLLALILAVMAGGSIWIGGMLGRINRVSETEPTLSDEEIENILQETDEPVDENYTGEVLNPEDVEMSTEPAEILEEEDHILNILLIGQDAREGQGRQRSDSMILCTVDTEKKTLVMTSFLRDLYVDIPEWNGKTYYDNRLNVNYAFGGMGMLDKCLEMNFGVVVDHNIEVNFAGFTEIVDLMGGVDIELTKGEAWYINLGKEDGSSKVSSGWNHLNGEQALTYSRIRKLDSDFGRTNRQRTVLNALLEKVRNSSLTDILALTDSIFPMITTDMENSEIVEVVMKVFPVLSELEVTTQHIPAEGTYRGASIAGMSVLVADMEANRQILKDTIG